MPDPDGAFDPGNPDTVGRLVVIALLAQERVPLQEIKPTYGSGVYAIYYTGQHPAYAEVAGTETPVYVGKADPKEPRAATPRQQGVRLFGRPGSAPRRGRSAAALRQEPGAAVLPDRPGHRRCLAPAAVS